MEGRVAVVACSSPLGLACARALSAAGATTVTLGGAGLSVAEVAERFGRVDVLVVGEGEENAMADSAALSVRSVLSAVNAEGSLARVRSLLPLLHAAEDGRVVVVSPPLPSRAQEGAAGGPLRLVGLTFLMRALAVEADVTCNAVWGAEETLGAAVVALCLREDGATGREFLDRELLSLGPEEEFCVARAGL